MEKGGGRQDTKTLHASTTVGTGTQKGQSKRGLLGFFLFCYVVVCIRTVFLLFLLLSMPSSIYSTESFFHF